MANNNVKRGALQQAIVLGLGKSKALAARTTGVSTSTIWQSINAYPGSGRTPWLKRTQEERDIAMEYAKMLLGE